MKNQLNFKSFFLLILSVFVFNSIYAQEVKKNKVRLKAEYVKIMGGESVLNLKVTSRIKRQNILVSNVDLIVYNEIEDSKIELGTATTNTKGECKFILKEFNSIQADSTQTYNFYISFKGNDEFKSAKKSISFKNADINAKLITKDSINYISAILIDASTKTPIIEESLSVQIQRLFRPLTIGEEFNYTDDNGSILVPIEEGIPGVDGNLAIEVVLYDSDDFGTVKAIVNASIGVPIVDESTFDDRTMWSPRNKTPLFILIFPNLLIFGIWGLIIYLITNLFKITKS